jgi:hypothetical protein
VLLHAWPHILSYIFHALTFWKRGKIRDGVQPAKGRLLNSPSLPGKVWGRGGGGLFPVGLTRESRAGSSLCSAVLSLESSPNFPLLQVVSSCYIKRYNTYRSQPGVRQPARSSPTSQEFANQPGVRQPARSILSYREFQLIRNV